MERVSTEKVIEATKQLLELKANFNFYMFFGGTNYNFMNGKLGRCIRACTCRSFFSFFKKRDDEGFDVFNLFLCDKIM